MENSLRTGGKSLGDKACLQPFMFQRKEEKKGERKLKKSW